MVLNSAFRKKLRLNQIVKRIAFADALIWAGYFMNNAIAALYLAGRIEIDPVRAVGFGYAIFLFSRATIQIPVSRYLDKSKGDRDELCAMLLGSSLVAVSLFLYLFITHEYHLYAIQFLFGAGAAIYLPASAKTFAKNTDKGGEGFDYAVYDVTVTMFAAVVIALASYFVNEYNSFMFVFLGASILTVMGMGVIVSLFRLEKPKKKRRRKSKK